MIVGKKSTLILGLVIVLLLVAAIMSVMYMNGRYDIIEDEAELKEEAKAMYAAGNLTDAIVNMETYCLYSVTDIEAKALLGDWYMESGESEKAYDCYVEAAKNKTLESGTIAPLSVKNTEEIILVPAEEYCMEITPDVRVTKDMTLTVTSYNLAPEEREEGAIDGDHMALIQKDRYYTTAWFDVDSEGEYLTMSGGFNCATWQFADKNGKIVLSGKSTNRYRRNDSYSVNIYQMARVVIPETAVKCRVTYFDKDIEDVTAEDEVLTIVYGRLPGESSVADPSYYIIPDLCEGEKLVYENGTWKKVTAEGEEILSDWKIPSLGRGSCVSISGRVPGRVSFANSRFESYSKNGIYTIRFDKNNPTVTGERMDDAKNLAFNGAVGEGFLSEGANDFDNIYPWNEMKLCSIKDGKIYYKGEEGFSDEGDSGDVFVEIPKFYVRRVADDNYDTISISGVMHEGFEVDEAFLTKDGEADKIYIAAYISSVSESGETMSISTSAPVLSYSPDELREYTEKKGEGYYEMDYAALGAVQKLFLVETGIRNSQCLYMGICAGSIASSDKNSSEFSVALRSANKTNCIDVDGHYPFNQGDNIIIFSLDNYTESLEKAGKDPRKVTAVIDNGDDTVSIFFSGEPMSVKEKNTAIAHVAKENGASDSVSYHTGAAATARGTVSFKYRNIENLWGNTYIFIDKATVKGGKVTLVNRRGEEKVLSYSLPTGAYSERLETMIKTVGYDEDNPTVMLPTKVGSGATSSTYYGDSYFYISGSDTEYVLHYGGGWNIGERAGLFTYAAYATGDRVSANASGRMMYIK